MGLATVPEYTTVEMTARDPGVILRTLWLFADWVPMTPFQRLIFHALVILFSLGLRQDMIMGMKFQDVAVAMVRDPVVPAKRPLVTTFTIWRYGGAFEVDYKSVNGLLYRPILEDVDYVPLEWKKGMHNKQIFPMSYGVFIRHLRRLDDTGRPFVKHERLQTLVDEMSGLNCNSMSRMIGSVLPDIYHERIDLDREQSHPELYH